MNGTKYRSDDPTVIAAAMIAGPFVLAGGIALLIASAIMRGFMLSVLWGWFIQNQFNTEHLSIGDAIGVSIVVTAFTAAITRDKSSYVGWFTGPMTMLAVGAVAHFIFGVGG